MKKGLKMQCITRRNFLKTTLSVAGISAMPFSRLMANKPGVKHPNIIFILADDMGWMDSEIYGSRYYQTPNINRLAQKGMLFTNAYSASPLCSPTRASILTGKYPGRLKLTTPSCHLPPLPSERPLLGKTAAPRLKMVTPESRRFLPLEEFTIGEAFHDAGYKTSLMGKWHLGHDEEYWPKNQGFDVDLGAPNPGPPSYFAPYRLENFPAGQKGKYVTDQLTEEALGFLEANKDKPFLLNLWHFAVHAPFQAKADYVGDWDKMKDPRDKQDCPTMAAMIKSMDEGIGKVLDKLDELNITDQTIIIFFSDNGGNMYDEVRGTTPTNNLPLRGGKGNCYEGGVRVPCIFVWPGAVQPGTRNDTIISSIDFYPTLLEIAGIPLNPRQLFDGISFLPALWGEPLNRKAIFCHHPHYTPATQNVPCTLVRSGDWKLLRLYGEGPDRTNSYELYNLREDMGEQNNLAEIYPHRVRELDAMIDKFLTETGSIVPIKNPHYQAPRTGWQVLKDASLEILDGRLKITSIGSNPSIVTEDIPFVSNSMCLRFRMRSSAKTAGRCYFQSSQDAVFNIDESLPFDIMEDDEWHEYQLNFTPNGPLNCLRIDPAQSEGIIEFEWIRLCRKYGEVLMDWTFSKGDIK